VWVRFVSEDDAEVIIELVRGTSHFFPADRPSRCYRASIKAAVAKTGTTCLHSIGEDLYRVVSGSPAF
jgi:hypothetical protein